MTEEEKKAIKNLNEFAYTIHGCLLAKEAQIILNLIQKQQKELKRLDREAQQYFEVIIKKDKIIDETCKFLEDLQLSKDIEGYEIMKKSDWKQYFEKKVEEEK